MILFSTMKKLNPHNIPWSAFLSHSIDLTYNYKQVSLDRLSFLSKSSSPSSHWSFPTFFLSWYPTPTSSFILKFDCSAGSSTAVGVIIRNHQGKLYKPCTLNFGKKLKFSKHKPQLSSMGLYLPFKRVSKIHVRGRQATIHQSSPRFVGSCLINCKHHQIHKVHSQFSQTLKASITSIEE